MSGFRCQFCKRSLTKVHYPKLYNMAHLLALDILLLPKDLTIIFIYSVFFFPSRRHNTESKFRDSKSKFRDSKSKFRITKSKF